MSFGEVLILWSACGFVIALISSGLGLLVSLPPVGWRNLTWPERARVIHPIRIVPIAGLGAVLLILTLAETVFVASFGPLPPGPWLLLANVPSIAAVFGVMLLGRWIVSPRPRPIGRWLAGVLTVMLVVYLDLIVMWAVIVATMLLPLGLVNMLFLLLIGAVLIALVTCGAGIHLARLLGLARPALPRATNTAAWAAERTGGPPAAAVFEVVWSVARIDALALPRYLVVSDSAVEGLGDNDLLELFVRLMTSFQLPWVHATLRIAASGVIYFSVACFVLREVFGPITMLIAPLVCFGSAAVILSLNRKLVTQADAMAAKASPDPVAGLRALERLYELNLTPVVGMMQGKKMHLYDRMAFAGAIPDYPRPRPPSILRVLLGFATVVITCLVLSFCMLVAQALVLGM